MDPRAALRERGRWTRATILSLLVESPGISRSAMARMLGLTAQAVSVQMHDLIEVGLAVDDGGLHVTPEGIEALERDAHALDDAAKHLRRPVAALDLVTAVAARPIRAGATVGLWMRDGELAADPDDVTESRGIASHDASAGDEVIVKAPEGVTPLEPGRIQILRVPAAAQGGIRGCEAPDPGAALVGAIGTGAAILARKAGQLDLRFAAAEAALNAAQRGLDVRLFVVESQLAEALQKITAGNTGTRRVEVRVEELGQA